MILFCIRRDFPRYTVQAEKVAVMSELGMGERTCCFTGHRPEKLRISEQAVIAQLEAAIQNAIQEGYTTFISGMAKGVDIWGAELVLQHPQVGLICAVPFRGFGMRWEGDWTERFCRVIKQADKVVYICPGYSTDVFQTRNIWMVDHSSLVIAAYNGTPGETRNTIMYAQSKADCEIYYLPL